MIVDCHVHLQWRTPGGIENVSEILGAMDEAGVDKVFLFSPCPYAYSAQTYVRFAQSAEKQLESMRTVATLVKACPERLIGFAWIDPLLPDAKDYLERAIADYKLQGVKMIPNRWYPYDERLFPVYSKIQELGIPVIFHSGILFTFGDSSRFCRPAFYEVMLDFPKIRFALAHMGWPWVDECLATEGRFRAAVKEVYEVRRACHQETSEQVVLPGESQMFLDITPGTPPIYRTEALRKAVAYTAEDRLIYGSDAFTTSQGMKMLRSVLETDRQIFTEELHLSPEARDKIMARNAMRFLSE